MKYRLIIGNTTWNIGQSLSEQAFQLYVYPELGILDLNSWKNLFQVHLYENKLRLRRQEAFYVDENHQEQVYNASDVLTLIQNRGWQIRNIDNITELYKSPSGKVLDEHDRPYTLQEILNIIEKGYTLTPCLT